MTHWASMKKLRFKKNRSYNQGEDDLHLFRASCWFYFVAGLSLPFQDTAI